MKLFKCGEPECVCSRWPESGIIHFEPDEDRGVNMLAIVLVWGLGFMAGLVGGMSLMALIWWGTSCY